MRSPWKWLLCPCFICWQVSHLLVFWAFSLEVLWLCWLLHVASSPTFSHRFLTKLEPTSCVCIISSPTSTYFFSFAFFLLHFASSICFLSSSFLWFVSSIFTSSLCFCFLLSFPIFVCHTNKGFTFAFAHFFFRVKVLLFFSIMHVFLVIYNSLFRVSGLLLIFPLCFWFLFYLPAY